MYENRISTFEASGGHLAWTHQIYGKTLGKCDGVKKGLVYTFQYNWNVKRKGGVECSEAGKDEMSSSGWRERTAGAWRSLRARSSLCHGQSLLFSGSNQTALGLCKDTVPLFISTVAHTQLIGILQLGHWHCPSSAVKLLRCVNVELWQPQTRVLPFCYFSCSV